jgi:hypothetical protein
MSSAHAHEQHQLSEKDATSFRRSCGEKCTRIGVVALTVGSVQLHQTDADQLMLDVNVNVNVNVTVTVNVNVDVNVHVHVHVDVNMSVGVSVNVNVNVMRM